MTWAGARGLLKPPVVIFGVAYDDPTVTAPQDLRYDAALVIPEDVKTEGEIGAQTIQGGKYAVTTHCGSYENTRRNIHPLLRRMASTERARIDSGSSAGVLSQFTLDTPPEKLLTDIYMPLAT